MSAVRGDYKVKICSHELHVICIQYSFDVSLDNQVQLQQFNKNTCRPRPETAELIAHLKFFYLLDWVWLLK